MHALDAQGWSYATEQTETKSELRGRDRGGNSLSAKQCWAGMYSRLFAHVTWLATDQRAVGHRWRGPERCTGRWICWERGTDEWKTRWASLITDHFSCFAQFWFMRGRVDVGVDCWETHIFFLEAGRDFSESAGCVSKSLPLLVKSLGQPFDDFVWLWLRGLSGFVVQKHCSSYHLTDFS